MLKQLDRRPDGNFVPVLTMRRDLDSLAKAFHLQVHKERDDLATFRRKTAGLDWFARIARSGENCKVERILALRDEAPIDCDRLL